MREGARNKTWYNEIYGEEEKYEKKDDVFV